VQKWSCGGWKINSGLFVTCEQWLKLQIRVF